jgi:hypothetical protein
MKGRVDAKYEEESKSGKQYWNVYVDSQKYSVWDRDVADKCEPGAEIEFQVREKGNFKNITSVGGASKEPAREPAKVNNTPHTTSRDINIMRQTCLKCATELVATSKDVKLTDRPDLVIAIMETLFKALTGQKEPEEEPPQDNLPV